MKAHGSKGLGRGLIIGFIAAGALLLLTSLLTFRSVERLQENQRMVAHTNEVLAAIAATLNYAHDTEAAQRGYLLAEEPAFVAEARAAIVQTRREATRLMDLTADNPEQQARSRRLREQLDSRMNVLQRVMELGRGGDLASARRLVADGPGEPLMRIVETSAHEIEIEERRLLAERSASSRRNARVVFVAFAATLLLNLGLLAIVARAVVRESQRQREAAEAVRTMNLQLETLNAELEQRVQARTLELQEANIELEAFAHSVAHDLRAPLRNMQGFAHALLEDNKEQLDESGRAYAGRIVYGAARLDALIQDLLTYSRLTRAEIVSQRVELDSLVRRVLQEMQSEIDERQASIEVETTLPSVMAHPPTLGQVLTNLIGNAIKFVSPGVRPLVAIRATDSENGVRLSIADNGIGVEPRFRERIFRVFERLHGQEAYPGTGIGLAIVRKGVERMGGKVGIAAAAGGGSEFWIELPAARTAT
jgi:signal transduction histidine kinase